MSTEKPQQFHDLVKAAHDAIDAYAESRVSADSGWFERDLDGNVRHAVADLLEFGLKRNIEPVLTTNS